MKPTFVAAERYRLLTGPFPSKKGDRFGAFQVKEGRGDLVVIVDDGLHPDDPTEWEHVSVHYRLYNPHRMFTPTWEQMCLIKDIFWSGDEAVVQFHPAHQNYVNHHPYTLHLWKQVNHSWPAPPTILV